MKLAVTPAGTPDTEKVTGELNPPNAVVARRTATLAFFMSAELRDPAAKEKPGTLTVSVAACVTPAPVAVTVTI